MKSFLFIFLFAISSLGFSQNNHIVKTEDGRRVLLKADFTWEYIDLETPTDNKIDIESTKLEGNDICNLPDGFVEPKLNKQYTIFALMALKFLISALVILL